MAPSDIACLASSPGSCRRQAACTAFDYRVLVPACLVRLPASEATRSKRSAANELQIAMAFLEMRKLPFSPLRTRPM